MEYLAIPNSTIQWANKRPEISRALAHDLTNIIKYENLKKTTGTGGNLRCAASPSGIMVAWNADYSTASGSDAWGIIKLSSPCGLTEHLDIAQDVLIRQMHVIGLRTDGLLLPEPYIHRSYPNNIHTCTAGGNDTLRRYSIGYYESSVKTLASSHKTIYCIGPVPKAQNLEYAIQFLINTVTHDIQRLPSIIGDCELTIATSSTRPTLDQRFFSNTKNITDKETAHTDTRIIPSSNALNFEVPSDKRYLADMLSYDEWVDDKSLLSDDQRNILNNINLDSHPLRITGSAGSGKTLLMQLLAIKTLNRYKSNHHACNILYVVHNSAMEDMSWRRFEILKADSYLDHTSPQHLRICTLSDYSRKQLDIDQISVIDKDASQAKEFQLEITKDALDSALNEAELTTNKTPLLHQVKTDINLRNIFHLLLIHEYGSAIKGHELTADARKYIESEAPLSRLHRQLTLDERAIVFNSFSYYHKRMFEELNLLDSDDIAISLVSTLRTPLWSMRRKKEGADYLFVDETHLFNENERRIFSLITKPPKPNLPIALALDQSQDIQGTTVSGFGKLGIEKFHDELLTNVPRCSPPILKLAFHFLQQTTDLFSPDFPDFTNKTNSTSLGDYEVAETPTLRTGGTAGNIGPYSLKQFNSIRSGVYRKIGIIVYGSKHWDDVRKAFSASYEKHIVLSRRGEHIPENTPIAVLCTPEMVGGQEFDAVIIIGLENGIVPPTVQGAASISATLEQQALRSLYLSITRAKHKLLIINTVASLPSRLLLNAIKSGLVVVAN